MMMMMKMMMSPCRALSNIKLSLQSKITIICMLLIAMETNFRIVNGISRQIDSDARTIFYHNQPPNALGEFQFEFQTTNGITSKAAGNQHGFSGVVQYISNEGVPVTMTYIADADGYHPTGDYIYPIPEYVLRSLEYIRTHPKVDEKSSRSL